jgi:iron uptake system component EfeO
VNRLKLLVVGAIGVLVVIVAALAVTFATLRPPVRPVAPGQVTVEVSDTACTPNALSVAAGAPAFAIKNTSTRAIEWEILDGVMVLAERENIAPGFTVVLTPRLEPGNYQMTCGLLSNPKGTLTVVAADGSTTALPAPPKLADLVAPTAEYRVYAIKTAAELTSATTAAKVAVEAGDFVGARTAIAAASTALAHLAPVVHLFQTDADPLSEGPVSLANLARLLASATSPTDIGGAARGAAAAASVLGVSISTTTASPHEIVAGAGTVTASLAKTATLDAAAQLAGVRKVIELFRPLTLRADKSLAEKLDTDLTAAEAAVGKSPAEPAATALADLGADLTDLLSALGLNVS